MGNKGGLKKSQSKLSRQASKVFGRVSEDVFGYRSAQQKTKTQLPSGWTVCYSKNGHPYLMKTDNTDAADNDAANEHKRMHYPYNISRQKLGEKFGIGIFLYFDFLLYLIATNFILLIIGAVAFALHMIYDDPVVNRQQLYEKYSTLFYSEDTAWDASRSYWMYCNIAAVSCWFCFGPIYAARVRSFFENNRTASYAFSESGADESSSEIEFVDLNNMEDVYVSVEDYIRDNEHVSGTDRLIRKCFSYFFYLVMLLVSTIVSFFLVIASVKSTNSTQISLLLSAIIAVSIKVMNMVAQSICVRLTKMEKHATWSSFRTHNTLKFFLFKMLNVLIMYASRILTPILCPLIPTVSDYCVSSTISCELSTLGIQLLFILVLDLTFQNIYEMTKSWVIGKWKANEGMMGKGSNESVLPEFDVAEEYLEVLYRQLIIYFAATIVPLAPALGLLCNIVEYKLDKYRLLYLCQHPRGLQGSMRNFLVFFLFITAAVALASPPYGAAWVLSGTKLCHAY